MACFFLSEVFLTKNGNIYLTFPSLHAVQWHGVMPLCLCRKFRYNTDSLLIDNYDTWHREIKKITSNEKRLCFWSFLYYSRLMALIKPNVSFYNVSKRIWHN